MKYGFVTGLPRSGSAWMANYLSYGSCCFLHDAWKDYTPANLRSFLDASGVYAGGTSDPGNLFIIDQIDKYFPEAKWVLITRSGDDVAEACKKLDFPLTDMSNQIKTLSQRDHLKVPFNEIFDRADEIGRYIYEGFDSPPWRKSMLKSLNVQLHWDKVSERFKVPAVLKQVETLTPAKISYYELIKEICNNDPNAIRFLAQARSASELYRQLNEGRPVDIQAAKDTLEAMATEWLSNPFVRSYFATLAPAIASAIEKYTNEKTLSNCPVDTELVTAVTYIFRGNDGIKEYMPKIRELSNKILGEKR